MEEAKRVFAADVALSYVNHLVDISDDDEDLREAYVRASALATVKPLREKIERDSDELVGTWFAEHRIAMLGLTDERQQEYEDIRVARHRAADRDMRRPRNRLEDFAVVVDGGEEYRRAAREEASAVGRERGLPSGIPEQLGVRDRRGRAQAVRLVGWFRNPSHNGVDSVDVRVPRSDQRLAVDAPGLRVLQPCRGCRAPVDRRSARPASRGLARQLQGLANSAERSGDAFHRIDATVKDGATWRVLDLKRADVRDAIKARAGDVLEL